LTKGDSMRALLCFLCIVGSCALCNDVWLEINNKIHDLCNEIYDYDCAQDFGAEYWELQGQVTAYENIYKKMDSS
jgi:hypothetical protein